MTIISSKQFGRRMVRACFIGAAFALGAIVLWQASGLLLLIFSGVLLAIFLDAVSEPVARRRPRLRPFLVVALMLSIGAAVIVGLMVTGPQLADQAGQLRDSIVNVAGQMRQWAMSIDAVEETVESSSLKPTELLPGPVGTALGGALSVIGITFSGLADLVLIAFFGLYLALSPTTYTDGAIRLLPVGRRNRTRDVLNEVVEQLRHWLLGTAMVMLVLAVVTYVGLKLIGVPLALLLAIVSGLAAFVPIIGPMVAGALMVLVAFSEGWQLALWAGGFYVLLQTLESYLLTPLIQERAVALPPAVVIAAQVLMGLLFGVLGVVLATPLAAVASVTIRRFYVEGLLEADG